LSAPFARVGLLGKAPCQADFIRLNAPAPVVHHFHRWLEDGVASLPAPLRRFPAAPVRFVYTSPGEKVALAGAMAASTDKVGRQFPLAIFCELDAASIAERFPLLPAALGPFLDGALRLIGAASSHSAAELAAQLGELPALQEAELSAADASRRQVLAERRTGALGATVGKEPPGAAFYAFRTFLSACVRDRAREPAKANVVLDCPLSPEIDPLPWLELARRVLQWRSAPPSFFWSAEGRLLLSLGPPPPSVVGFLANPAQTGTKLWPLRAAQPSSIPAAKDALTPAQRDAIGREDASLEELLGHLTREGG
jgi:type VI secretion system protein ImpM